MKEKILEILIAMFKFEAGVFGFVILGIYCLRFFVPREEYQSFINTLFAQMRTKLYTEVYPTVLKSLIK